MKYKNMAEIAKQEGEIGISGSRVNRIRSLLSAHTHQKLEVSLLSELRYVKQKQARKDYTNDQVQAAKSRVENLEILPAAHTQDRLKVRTVSIIWQIIIKTLSRC